MAESAEHMRYVGQIVSYIETFPNCFEELIEADLPDYNGRTTKVLGSYYPDVYYINNNMIIIGEAKTEKDIENMHTKSQLTAYIEEVKLYQVERHIILACSIFAIATMKNFVIHLKQNMNTNGIVFHFIDSFNRVTQL